MNMARLLCIILALSVVVVACGGGDCGGANCGTGACEVVHTTQMVKWEYSSDECDCILRDSAELEYLANGRWRTEDDLNGALVFDMEVVDGVAAFEGCGLGTETRNSILSWNVPIICGSRIHRIRIL